MFLSLISIFVLKFVPERRLHNLTDALVGEEQADLAEDENLEHVQDLHQDHLVRPRIAPNKSNGEYLLR